MLFRSIAQNWEIILFVVGVLLLLAEIFVIPGWGIAGVSGIILIVFSLTMSMIDNNIFKYEGGFELSVIIKPLALVLTSLLFSGIGMLYFGKKFLSANNRFMRIALNTNLNADEGFVSVENTEKSFVGTEGKTITPLNPTGRIMIENDIYTAIAEYGFIEKGVNVIITRFETGQFYCEKK